MQYILYYFGISIKDSGNPLSFKDAYQLENYVNLKEAMAYLKPNSSELEEVYSKLMVMSILIKKMFIILVKISGIRPIMCNKEIQEIETKQTYQKKYN